MGKNRKQAGRQLPVAKGAYKLAVFFVDHRHPRGQAYYFNSTKRQDDNGTAKRRLKYLVDGKWRGKVSWAGLYFENGLVEVFRIGDNRWSVDLSN